MVALSSNLAETYFVFHSGNKLANSNCLHFVLKKKDKTVRFTSSAGVEESTVLESVYFNFKQ